MKKIKIFVDGHWFDDLYQSTCVFLKGLYSELLQDERFQIYIAAVDTNQLKKVFNYSDKINYLPYRSSSKYYRLAADIPRLIRQHNIDVSHFQYVSPLVKNSIEIVTIHDILFKEFKELFPWNYRFTKDFLFKRSAKRAELVTTVSQYSCDAIMKHYSIPSERIKIVPNGISEDFFTLNSQEGHSIREKNKLKEYVLYVSRIEPRKNHLSLLKAYVQAELWKDSIKLVFVGRTDIQVSELNDLMSSLPDYIFKNIVWLENV
jgi:glycosyltransferase involved in cell wall biosynthesis